MYHPTTRVLATLELLQTHGRMSGSELAARLGVNGRTLRRYIARLEDLGIPIAVEHGRHGGYMLVAGYKLPPMMFTDEEALALSVGLLAARGLGLADTAPGVAGAQAKLERVMPADLRRRVRAADDTMALDLPRQPASADGAALAALSAAAQARRRVHLAYRSAEAALTEREFDPYGLAYRGGCWYAVGHCHLRKGLRSFRIDRIHGVRATGSALRAARGLRRPRPPRLLRGHDPARLRGRGAPEDRPRPGAARALRDHRHPGAGGRRRASCAARPTTSTGSRGSWRACPSTSRSGIRAALREALRVRARALLARAAGKAPPVSRRR